MLFEAAPSSVLMSQSSKSAWSNVNKANGYEMAYSYDLDLNQSIEVIESVHEKTNNLGFRPGLI